MGIEATERKWTHEATSRETVWLRASALVFSAPIFVLELRELVFDLGAGLVGDPPIGRIGSLTAAA